jgi:uncharacterized protein (TIGR02246 family)
LLSGCGQTARQASQDDIAAIRKLLDDFCAAHAFNDGAKLAEFYTDDAILMPSDEPIVSGKAAIASRYQQDIEKFTAELTTTPDEIDVSGNLAFVRGTFTIKLTPKSKGEKVEITFKAVSILRKGTDGSWKLYCDIWNSDIPMPPKDQAAAPSHQFELMMTDNPKRTADGLYEVGWIRVLRPGRDAPVQVIPVEMNEPEVYWAERKLERQDIDFDGYTDIAVTQHGGAKWGRFHWWLYDPERDRYYSNSLTEELSELTCASLKADPKSKRITRTQFIGTELKEYVYEIVGGRLHLCESGKPD